MIRFLFSQKFYIKKRLSYLPYLDYASRNTKQIILYGMKWAITCLWSGKQDAIFSCCWCIRCLWRQIWECVYVCMLCTTKSFLHFLPCFACSLPIFLSSFLVFSCRWNLFFFLLFLLLFLVSSSTSLVNFQIQTAHDLHLKRKKKRKNEGSWIFIFVGWWWALLRGSLLTSSFASSFQVY